MSDIENKDKNQNDKRKLNEYNNYIPIYFKDNALCSSGFCNSYRENISFIIDTEDKNTKLNKSDVDSSSLSLMVNLFKGCYSLESKDFSNFDSFHVFEMGEMFEVCTSLKSLNLSNFYTPILYHMNSVFIGCISLKTIEYMNYLFNGCTALELFSLSFYFIIN